MHTSFQNTAVASVRHPVTGEGSPEMERKHEIIAGHLLLRPVRQSDLDDYVALTSDPEVMRYIGVEAGKLPDLDDMQTLVRKAVEAWEQRGYGRWSIFDRETGKFIGFIGFRCHEDTPELLCLLFPEHWGTGEAQLAASECLSYGFAHLGFPRVISFTRPDNARARGLLDKLGARFTGSVDFHSVPAAGYEFLPVRG